MSQRSSPNGRNKFFVLDTNVLLHNPEALFMFGDNQVVIPFTVVEELDSFKKNTDDTGRNARQVIRHLDRLRGKGKLSEGVQWNGHGGSVRIELTERNGSERGEPGEPQVPGALRADTPDNRIIAVAYEHFKAGDRTTFISKDINARIKSDALGIPTQDFEAQKVDADRLYTGYRELDVPAEVINRLYEAKSLPLDVLEPFIPAAKPHSDSDSFEPMRPPAPPGAAAASAEPADPYLLPNQFVLLRDPADPSHTGLARRYGKVEAVEPVTVGRRPVFGIVARNVQQTMALDLLLDDSVRLITMLGTAGSGKTLLALAAGMMKTLNETRYDRLLVARPIMPMGRDLGYLPGTVEEKLSPWMQPIFDNLTYLLSTRGSGGSFQHAESKTPEQRIKALVDGGRVVLEPLTYIRGRSIPNQFMIVDEAQNLTPHEVKTIASRVGDGTKLVLTGDIQQIDNPYLDSSSNGLSYLVEQLKGQPIVGHVLLAKSERSELASLVAEKL